MNRPPEFPAGPPPVDPLQSEEDWHTHLDMLASAPRRLRASVVELSDTQLDTPYRNWSVRQIVHHIADSHVNAYARFKLALTEQWATIRPYDEGAWTNLLIARTTTVEHPLALLDGLHTSWHSLLETLTADQRTRGYIHPDGNERIPLTLALPLYTWHGSHHTAQINWLAREHNWK